MISGKVWQKSPLGQLLISRLMIEIPNSAVGKNKLLLDLWLVDCDETSEA